MPSRHPLDVAVDRDLPVTEGDRRDRTQRVGADARQSCQVFDPAGHPAAVFGDDEPGTLPRVLATMPLRQLARPDDIATAALFLASPTLARHVSGEILTVAGGMDGRRLWTDAAIDPDEVRRRLDT